ncbi:hypothetical protein ACE6H2_013806 [Prunus campanulata]
MLKPFSPTLPLGWSSWIGDKPSYDFDDIKRQGRPTKWSTAEVNGILAPKGRTLQLWNNIFVISCVVAVSLDPLFLYIPIIKEKNKCLGMDKKLRNAALVLRSLTDIIFVVRIVHQIRTKLEDSEEPAEGRESLGWKWRPLLCVPIIIDLLAILPIPQVNESLAQMEHSSSSQPVQPSSQPGSSTVKGRGISRGRGVSEGIATAYPNFQQRVTRGIGQGRGLPSSKLNAIRGRFLGRGISGGRGLPSSRPTVGLPSSRPTAKGRVQGGPYLDNISHDNNMASK